jgi:hypothetical protein
MEQTGRIGVRDVTQAKPGIVADVLSRSWTITKQPHVQTPMPTWDHLHAFAKDDFTFAGLRQ